MARTSGFFPGNARTTGKELGDTACTCVDVKWNTRSEKQERTHVQHIFARKRWRLAVPCHLPAVSLTCVE